MVNRLVNIDSKLSIKEGIYYKPADEQSVVAEYKDNTAKIDELTKELKHRGY